MPASRPGGIFRDFNAFYCAGAALDARADPYLAEPLGRCERSPRPAGLSHTMPYLSVPAPLPPYALLPFAALARLPYAAAAAIWALIILAAYVLTLAALRTTLSLSWPVLVSAFGLGAYAALDLGQIAPLALAAIAVAAAYAERERYVAAALAASVAMLEPHVGLPACAALFLWRPQARLPLALAAAAFLAASLAASGPSACLEYLSRVLPAHAATEIVNERQYSLTYLLHRLGVPDSAALRAGEWSYVAMLAAGVAIAPRLARRLDCPALIVALPSAFGLAGGPFVHVAQLSAALPAALLLFDRLPTRRIWFGAAIVGLAVPAVQFTSLGSLFPLLGAAAIGVLAFSLFKGARLAAALAAAGAFAWLQACASLIVTRVPDAGRALRSAYDPRALAETSWALYVRIVGTSDPLAYDLAKIPAWIALGIIVVSASGIWLAGTPIFARQEGSPHPRRRATD